MGDTGELVVRVVSLEGRDAIFVKNVNSDQGYKILPPVQIGNGERFSQVSGGGSPANDDRGGYVVTATYF